MTPESTARLEDVRWMAETGEHLDGAARRLGITTDALEVFLRRYDRDCLAALLARRPRDHNRFAFDGFSICELTGLTRRRQTHKKRRDLQGAAA